MRTRCNTEGIKQAAEIINKGGIAIFPTDTVYGIGCNPYNPKSVKKIYEIKSRDISKPFPILAFSKDIAKKIVSFDKLSERFADHFWPGPLTIILRSIDKNIESSLNLSKKIAIRVPDHKCTSELLRECNFLIGTSANVSGHPSTKDPEECFRNIEDYDVFVDGGMISSKGESTIIEIEGKEIKIIREGSLSREDILSI